MTRASKIVNAISGDDTLSMSVVYGTVAAVREASGAVTVDADVDGGRMSALPMTIGCRGIAVGDRVIIETYGRISIVTGVIARSNAPDVKVLWSGSGLYMNASQSATLSEPVSAQAHGIVLHWQAYVSGATQNYDHNYIFVSKTHVSKVNGQGVAMFLTNSTGVHVSQKYVYVNDTSVTGNANNTADSTTKASNIKIEPKYFVLTEILGV